MRNSVNKIEYLPNIFQYKFSISVPKKIKLILKGIDYQFAFLYVEFFRRLRSFLNSP